MRPHSLLALACASLASLTLPAQASSDDAWSAFRAKVDAACRALVTDPGEVDVEVNPFGSQNYGAALVTLTAEGGLSDRMICIYDKTREQAELTAPFAPPEALVEPATGASN